MSVDRWSMNSYLVNGTDAVYYIPEFVTEEEESYLIRKDPELTRSAKLEKIQETPQPKWRKLVNRRLQIWGGDLTAKNTLIPETFPPFINQFPNIIERIQSTGAFQASAHGVPNHVILNEYLPGQGIMRHEDGPSYHPVVATLSLSSHAVFHYYQYKPDADKDISTTAPSSATQGRSINPTPVLSILLEPRSLVITTSSLYISHLHGIDDISEDVIPPVINDDLEENGIRIANVNLLGSPELKDVTLHGGMLRRGTRYSLTCRDVEKVAARIPIGKR